MSLTLIIGPMYARKSSALVYYAEQADYGHPKKEVLVVKPKIDSRYDANMLCTHSGVRIGCKLISAMSELCDIDKYDVILIDEGQFIPDLREFVIKHIATKKIVVAGLNGDFNMQPFPSIVSLIPLATEIKCIKAWCDRCGNEANFTYLNKNFSGATTNNVLIGGKEKYQALCFKCFSYINSQV
jgi:thymidine kinase